METQVRGEKQKEARGAEECTKVPRPVPGHSGGTRVLSSSEREKSKRMSD